MNYATEAKAEREPSITAAVEEFDRVLERTADYAARLQKVADRVIGPQPTEVSDSIQGKVAHSLIGSIHERRNRLVELLNQMERSLGSLERGV